ELNFTGGNDTYIRCDKESRYIDSLVFNLFAPCFEAANKLYDYYGPTKYNARKIIPLRNELINYKDGLEAIQAADKLKELVSQHFLGREFLEALDKEDEKWQENWTNVRDKLIEINQGMIDLTEKCADEEKILWVVGY
ncbi:MAG: hypothetical protein JW801_04430, partial [Bacteroidales bacterium]|nr:hypothetical protein [Bacteroidales bacterium]